jgi:hypothetical protein
MDMATQKSIAITKIKNRVSEYFKAMGILLAAIMVIFVFILHMIVFIFFVEILHINGFNDYWKMVIAIFVAFPYAFLVEAISMLVSLRGEIWQVIEGFYYEKFKSKSRKKNERNHA